MATILTKRSNTASSVPVAGDLTNSTGGAELAVNTADKRLFTKDSGGTVVELGTNPSSLSLPNGTANAVPYLNGSKVLTSGSALTFDGTNFATTGKITARNDITATNGSVQAVVTFGTGKGIFGTLSNDDVAFFQNNAEQMRLTSTGLGIGTSSPTAIGSSKVVEIGTSAGNSSFLLFSVAGSLKGSIYSNASETSVGSISSTPLLLKTGDTTRATLDSSGNLGLGVTPSAWDATNARALQLSAGSVWSYTTIQMNVGQNYYYNGTSYIYKNTAAASSFDQSGGAFYWKTAPSGTAGNAISFTQAMTLSAAGGLSVGTTSDAGAGNIWANGRFYSGDGSASNNAFARAAGTGSGMYFPAADTIGFSTSGSERARIDSSGNLLVGRTSFDETDAGVNINNDGLVQATRSGGTVFSVRRTSSDGSVMDIRRDTTIVGSISVTTSSTSYNTSSDYRLKNTIAPMTGALAKVAALKPCIYKWNADGSDGEGFIAHELAEVCPQAVTGEKDAVDADGNPVYQGIDTSFLVATLTAAIQELKAEVDSLKSEINTLKGI